MPPVLLRHPRSLTIPVGACGELSVLARGHDLRHVWQRRAPRSRTWVRIAGVGGRSLEVRPTRMFDSRTAYRCVVSGRRGNVVSEQAELLVTRARVSLAIGLASAPLPEHKLLVEVGATTDGLPFRGEVDLWVDGVLWGTTFLVPDQPLVRVWLPPLPAGCHRVHGTWAGSPTLSPAMSRAAVLEVDTCDCR